MAMKKNVEKIVAEVLDLPSPVRAFLAAKLLESLDVDGASELSSEWKEEIRRRCQEIDEGTARLVEAEEAFARAYSKLT
jgi:putative addiction module component (TIGR02574 family)